MLQTKVVIAGAGPTGLMMACQLRRMGIDCLVVDKKEGPTRESRALVVHARSMEIYDQMGLADEVVAHGQVLTGGQLIVKGKKIAEVRFGDIGKGLSRFPYMLVYEQSKNEELLYSYLLNKGGDVLWESEVIEFSRNENAVSVLVKNKDGEEKKIEADFLIAADGAKSIIRHELELKFSGGSYEHIFFVADSKVEWPWSHEALGLCFSKETFMALFPMQGKNRFRVVGILPSVFQDEHPDSFEQIIPFIHKSINIPVQFSETSWFSIYRLHHRCVDQFRVGRIFLCGDAAHIHSPAGGQGMNTGLQDAYNLAWKIVFVLKGHASEKLLDSYQQERLPFAKRLLATTDSAFSFATSGKWYNRFLRLYIIPVFTPLLFRIKKFRRFVFYNLSQIAISYFNSSLTPSSRRTSLNSKAGERFPYLLMKDGSNFYDQMKEPVFHLLFFSKIVAGEMTDNLKIAEKEFTPILKTIMIAGNEIKMMESMRVKNNIYILVRPDHYISLIAEENDFSKIREYLLGLRQN